MLLELLLELDDMFKHEFLLGGVLTVGHRGRLLLFELAAALQLLVYHVFAALEEFVQLVVHLGLHFKIIELIHILNLSLPCQSRCNLDAAHFQRSSCSLLSSFDPNPKLSWL